MITDRVDQIVRANLIYPCLSPEDSGILKPHGTPPVNALVDSLGVLLVDKKRKYLIPKS